MFYNDIIQTHFPSWAQKRLVLTWEVTYSLGYQNMTTDNGDKMASPLAFTCDVNSFFKVPYTNQLVIIDEFLNTTIKAE